MSYYGEKLAEHGDGIRALGWGSEMSQRLRFRVLCEIADLRGASILDYGCGFGDLSDYVRGAAEYIGYDSNPDMLRLARARYPWERFVEAPVEADYVLESGAFNLRTDWHDEARNIWQLCRRGAALNFTSNLAKRQTRGIVYADPFETARFCASLSPRFRLRHDYKDNDFTLYLYK